MNVTDQLKKRPKLSTGLVLLLVLGMVGVLVQFNVLGSFANGDYTPRFGECTYDEDTGNIQGGCEDRRGELDAFSRGVTGAYDTSTGEPVSKHFWIRIDGIRVEVDDGDGDEQKVPQFYWLYKNDYVTEDGLEEINDGGFPDDVDLAYGDLEWGSDLKNGLEAGTVCKATIKPESRGGVTVKYYENGQEKTKYYNDEPEGDERHVNYITDPSTVTASDVRITDRYMACKFDFTEVMNKGLDEGQMFSSWTGREIIIGGHDGDEGSTRFDIDFGIDSDKDGKLDENDECPDEAGSRDSGCPNSVPEITSFEVPENMTSGESYTVSAQAEDGDGDQLTYSWSNGQTGSSTTFTASGNKTMVSVNVSDSFDSVEKSVTVPVLEGNSDETGEGSTNDPSGKDSKNNFVSWILGNYLIESVIGLAGTLLLILFAIIYRRRGE